MGTLESQEVVEAFGKVVECAIAHGKAQAAEELHESRMLTVLLAEVPGYKADTFGACGGHGEDEGFRLSSYLPIRA